VADSCVTFCSVDSTVIAQQVARSVHGARCNVSRTIWRWHALLFAKRETKDAAVGANEVVGAVAAVVVFVALGCVLPVDGHKRNVCFIARVSLVDLTETSGNVHKSVGAQQQPDDDDDDDDTTTTTTAVVVVVEKGRDRGVCMHRTRCDGCQ
jgi:hypothetical protein